MRIRQRHLLVPRGDQQALYFFSGEKEQGLRCYDGRYPREGIVVPIAASVVRQMSSVG